MRTALVPLNVARATRRSGFGRAGWQARLVVGPSQVRWLAWWDGWPGGMAGRAGWGGQTIAFRSIWLQTLVAVDSESRLTLFPSFCTAPSQVAVLFYSNLSRRPFLAGQVVDFDLLLCRGFHSEHAVLFLCHIYSEAND